MTRFETFNQPNADVRLSQVAVPGTEKTFVFARAAGGGALLRVSCGDRVYFDTGTDGWTRLDGGLGRFREARDADSIRRDVQTPHRTWQEVYRFDADSLLAHVDGVDMYRDAAGRVTACVGDATLPAHRWFYAYTGDGLVSVAGPQGVRHLSRMVDGRVVASRQGGQSQHFGYDGKGRRKGIAALPKTTHHRDGAGRVWCVTDPTGRVATTYIWDGWRCIGRIDGPPGAPLAAVFCLDPTATPVRVITAAGVVRIPRDAYGEGLCARPDTPGLFGAFQSGGLHHLPWRILDPALASFTAPDPFDGSEDDPRRGPGAVFEGDLDIETDRQRPYDVCRNDPIGRADPSGGISVGLLISSLTWSFQNNLVSFFGIDWWFNLFGSMFTGANFFSSDVLTASDHIGAFGFRRDGVISKITGGRAFTTQHLVWDTAEGFDSLNDGMVIDPKGTFDPPLMGGLLLAAPQGNPPFLLRADPGRPALNWQRNGGDAAPSFPGASQPVFPGGGFHLASAQDNLRGPLACPLTELVPGAGLSTATADATAVVQLFRARSPGVMLPTVNVGDPVMMENASRDRIRTRIVTAQPLSGGTRLDFTVADPVPNVIGPTNINLTQLVNTTTQEVAQAPGGAVQGFSARGLAQIYGVNDVLEIRSQAGGADVTICRATGPEVRLPLNSPAPAAMVPPLRVIETTLTPPVPVTLDGTDGIAFADAASAPASGIIGLVSNGTIHIPVRVGDTSATPVLRTDATLSSLGAPGTAVTFQRVTSAGPLGSRAGAVEAAAEITYVPSAPGAAPDGSAGPVVVLISGTGAPDAPRLVTAAPVYDAILTDVPVNAGAAPWTVEKWTQAPAPNTIGGIATIESIAVTPDDPSQLTGAEAVRILSLAGAANVATRSATAIMSPLAMTGAVGRFVPASGAMPATPRVTDVVALRQGSTDSLFSVARLRLSFNFDRPVAMTPDTENFIVRLRRAGFEWSALRVDNRTVTLTPMVAGTRGQFPRIRSGAAIRLAWEDGGTPNVQIYRVTAVEGLTLTLDGITAIPATLDPATLTAQLLEADDPGTGHQKIAINLSRAPGAATTAAQADVWTPDAFASITNGGGVLIAGGALGFGIVSGGITTPVVIQPTGQILDMTFASDPGLSGNADMFSVTELESFELPVVGAVGNPLMLEQSQTALDVVLLQPFVPSPFTAPEALLHPGSVLIPEDERIEVTRRQALVDHELVHTEQYHKFGPIWFCYFPLFLAELPVEFTTELDQPSFGPSVPATLERLGARIRITPQSALGVSDGDEIQLLQGGDHGKMTVASVDGATLIMRGSSDFRAGALQVRRVNDNGIWPEVLLNIGRVATHGGLLNTAVGFTWGGLLWLLSKGIYGAVRAIGGAGDQYPGTIVESGRAVDLTDAAGRRELNANGQFIIKSGDVSVVRSASRSGDRLILDQPVELTGVVQVSAYASLDPGSAFDWLSYHAGTVDADNSAAIDLPDHGSDFTVGDRIEYHYLGRSERSHITAITGNRIEIEDPIAISGAERSIRVALVAEAGTTLANADEAALNWMGMGWMRILFDPYGQIEARVRPEETWAVVLLRIMRVLMGSRNWSALPLLGYLFNARLFAGLPWCPPEHRTMIEQQSSDKSGDLYTPLSRLLGTVRRDGRYADTFMAVGDIARLRYWTWTSARDLSVVGSTAEGSDLGAPGLHVDNRGLLRVIINRTSGPDVLIPNGDVVTDAAGAFPPALGLPDRFYTKSFDGNLGLLPAGADIGLSPADLGAVPLSPTLVRNPSAYVAFCRPGTHRATVTNSDITGLDDETGLANALDAQEHDRQNIWFNVTASDVVVRLNGQDVTEGATMTLVQTQTAQITVETTGTVPDIARTFRATVARPATSPVLRATTDRRLVAQAANTGATPEPVEISRFYDFDEASGTYADPALAAYGLHLGGDLDIPVRSFDVIVTDQLTLRATADPAAAEVTTLAQGDTAFVLIPTSAGEVTSYLINGAAAIATDPELLFETVATPPAAAGTVGPLGQVRSVRFAATPRLAASAAVSIAVPVTGEDGSSGTLRLAFTLDVPAP